MQKQLSEDGNDFQSRSRHKLGEILKFLYESPSNAICHILSNDDCSYSLMYHIVCEYCDYCDSQGDCRDIFSIERIVPAKEDPYKLVYKEEEQFLKEDFFWCYWFYDWCKIRPFHWCDIVNDKHCGYCGQETPPYGCKCKKEALAL